MCFTCGCQNDAKKICLILTNACNKKCPYCIEHIPEVSKNNIRQFNIKNISRLDKFKDLSRKSFAEISIMGGEPGLVTKDKLDILFNYLKLRQVLDRDIYILTNGLFLKRYSNIYNEYIYDYHITSLSDYVDYSYLNLKLEQLYIVYNIDSLDELEAIAKISKNLDVYISLDRKMSMLQISDKFYNKLVNILNNNKNILVKMDSDYLFIKELKDRITKNKKYLNLFHKLFYDDSRRKIISIDLF